MRLFGWELRRVPTEPGPEPAAPPEFAPQPPAPDARSFLAPALLREEPWAWPDAATIQARLVEAHETGRIWRGIPHGHKWLSYFEAYDAVLGHLRGRAPRILEIGVQKGSSLRLWKRYFGDGTRLTGVDIDPACLACASPEEDIHVRIGSQADPDFLAGVVQEFGPFDLVIDDGSHVVSHQVASFNALFDASLAEGGIYLVEDLETSYWGARSGQLDLPVTFVDVAKAVIDLMHHPYTRLDYPAFRIEVAAGGSIDAPRISRMVEEVRIFDSIVAFRRKARIPPVVQFLD